MEKQKISICQLFKSTLELCDKHLHVLMFYLMCIGLAITTVFFSMDMLTSAQWIDSSTKLFAAASLIVSITKLKLSGK